MEFDRDEQAIEACVSLKYPLMFCWVTSHKLQVLDRLVNHGSMAQQIATACCWRVLAPT
jgi:hypothetical protein